ncbi:MAG: hypothetical protein LBG90_03395 [Spirochaetaceae bacterium]|jgi:hypothetical protein|nr:hypothetical protein [Spirochaetaceae bacterium]
MKYYLYLFFFLPAEIFGLPLDALVDTEHRTALLSQGTVMEAQFKAPEPRLVPRYVFVENLTDSLMQTVDPTLFVETLHLYKKSSGAGLSGWTSAERRGLFNNALALSSLTGIQYYSNSRKAMRTFYEISTVIDGPATKRPLPDPVYGQPPQEVSLYARQKDLTFGDNIYRYTYYAQSDGFVFVQENYTALVYGIVPAVGKGNLRSIVAVIDAEDYLLIYAASMAKAVSLPGMNQQIGKSFSSRVDALLQWFTRQADKAFASVR